MESIFLFIGPEGSVKNEVNKLLKRGFKPWQLIRLEGEPTAIELLKKIKGAHVTDVVCIETRNGQTGHWASEIKKFNNGRPYFVKVFGIDILPHPQNVEPKSLAIVKKIACVTEIFQKKPLKKVA